LWLTATPARAVDAPPPRTFELWPQGAPGARGTSLEDRPAVTAFLPKPGTSTGAAILVVPGGGFTRRCEDHEGVIAAEWLRARGIAAFLLRYRVVPMGTVKDSLEDVHRGMQYVRAHAKEWGLSPERLGAMGFSAGATLAADVSLRPRPARPDPADPVDGTSSRPAFVVFAYGGANQSRPGVRGLTALGLTKDEAAQIFAPTAAEIAAAPPAFMFCTAEDASHVRGMSDLYARLTQAGVPAEAHFFAYGEHGVGFAPGDPVLGEWPSLLVSWMRTSGFLTEASRVALRGSVTLDGQPLPRGTVILTPPQGTGAPAVIAYVFGTTEGPGQFALPAARGPVPGRYRVEVRQDATRWSSNSRDPVLRKMQEKMRETGALEAADVEEWVAWARTRDFSPSIEGQRVYSRRRRGDAEEIVVEITPGGENRLDLVIASR
ncbi:MAG TPA: alpha/beta hydrolase, partial [Vicinamibacteria bacterium]|nr:alpha/beta hydrolase [Vicinamibacteria bacterium]